MRAYFERGTGFIELRAAADALVISRGPIGGASQERAIPFTKFEDAKAAFDHQVDRLERKGYLAGRHEPRLLQAIREAPESVAPYLVYADWLLERKDPRGELISAMAAGDAPRAAELLNAHPVQLRPSAWEKRGVVPTFFLGFVQRLEFRRVQEPGELIRVLEHPSCVVLRELVISHGQSRHPWCFISSNRALRENWLSSLARRPATVRKIVVPKTATMTALGTVVPGLSSYE